MSITETPPDSTPTLLIRAKPGSNGRTLVVATCDKTIVHSDEIVIGIAEARESFLNQLAVLCPAVGANEIRAELNKLALQRASDLVRPADSVSVLDAPKSTKTNEKMKPFPLDLLPGTVATFVDQTATAIGCDTAFLVPHMLTSLASAIGNTRRIQLKRGWCEPSIVWSMVIASSGSLKTPTMNSVVSLISKRNSDSIQRHAQAMEDYRQAVELFESRKKGGDTEVMKPIEPIAERQLINNVTIEAVLEILESNPRGLMLAVDELAGLFGSFGEYKKSKGGDFARWLSIWSNQDQVVDRKTASRKTINVPRANVSICGTIQPATVQNILTPEMFNSGMVPRFLMVAPPVGLKRWTDLVVPDLTTGRMDRLFDYLYSLQFNTNSDRENAPLDIPLSSLAAAEWHSFYNEHAERIAGAEEKMAAALSKLEAYSARLALICHMCRVATGDADESAIDLASVQSGIAMGRWFAEETERVYKLMGETESARRIRLLIEYIEAKGGTISLSDFKRNRRLTEDQAEEQLQMLVDSNRGKWDWTHGEKGGRPSKVFILKSASTAAETPDDDSANEGLGYCSKVVDEEIGGEEK